MQAVLNRSSRPKRSRHEFRYGGLLTCTCCGCAVVGDLKKGQSVYYRCSHRRGLCPEGYVRQEVLEGLLRERLGDTLKLSPEVVQGLEEAAQEIVRDADHGAGETRRALEGRLQNLERKLAALLDLRLAGHLGDEEYAAKRAELLRAQRQAQEALAAFELPQMDPREGVHWFVRTCNEAAAAFQHGTDADVRTLLRIVGSNYRLGAGKVDFEPVEPFTLAAQARNCSVWRAAPDDVRTLLSTLALLKGSPWCSESTKAGTLLQEACQSR